VWKWISSSAASLYVSKRNTPVKFTTASLGSWHQFKSCADDVIQSLESEENDEAAYRQSMRYFSSRRMPSGDVQRRAKVGKKSTFTWSIVIPKARTICEML